MAYILRIDKDGGQLTSYRIENVKVTHSLIEDGNLTFGNIPSACVTFDLYGSGPSINNSPVTLYYGEEQDDDTIKYSVIGTFNVNIVSKDAVKTSYEGYDAMVYALSGTYKSSLDWSAGKMWHTTDIIKDIATQSGITYVGNTDCPLSAVFSSEPKNLSYRTVIGYIAGLDGYNAIIKYTEKGVPYISMVCFNKTWKYSDDINIDDKIIYMDGFELSVDETVKIEYVKTFTDDTNYLVSGDESAGYGITTFNPYMNQDWNDDIFQMYTTLDRDICGISVKFFGFWNIELCDVVPVTHNGITFNVPVMSIEQECDGGLITTIKSYLQNVTVEYSATQTVQNTSNQIVIHKIKQDFDNLNAKSITTENLTAKVAEITTLKATDAIIKNIQTEAITTNAIKASVAQIDSLTADDAIIKSIYSDKIVGNSAILNILQSKVVTTEDLSAKVANINSLTANSAIIKNIQSTAITTDSIKASVADINSLTANSAIVQNLFSTSIIGNSAILNNLQSVVVTSDLVKSKVSIINTLNADDAIIKNIQSVAITTDAIKASVAKINSLTSDDAIIKNIQSTAITTDAIKASVANINSLTATDAIIKNIYSESILSNTAILNTLQAKVVSVEHLSSKVAQINNLKVTDAIIKNIQSVAITTDAIKASVANINTLTAKDAIIENISTKLLEADSGFINKLSAVSLNADNATISDLIAKTAKINNLIYGSATGTSITTEFSNSVIAQLGSAQIKNAMIDSVSASKINAGTINTNDVTIQSSDGNMLLKGSLQQFKDKDGNVRIQIGQDTSGSFNFIVKGSDGSTALFDSNGITKDGVPDGLIVDAKVSENANINGSKLNIDSVISGINDNNSTYLKTSKIYSDVDNQTLEVLFARHDARIEGVENVAFGQIVTYNVDEIPTLDNYPAMDWVSGPYPADDLFPSDNLRFQYSNEEYRKHLGSICYVKNNTSTYKFVVNADGECGWKEVTDSETAVLNQKVIDIQASLDGVSSRVSNAETKINSHDTSISSMQSSIQQNAESIQLRVTKDVYDSGMSGKANKSSIISEINQSAESIQINASRLNLTGYVTLTNLSTSGQTNIDGGNITTGKIDADRIDANNLHVKAANIDNKLTATQIDATNLHVSSANIDGVLKSTQIDATEIHVSSANIDGTISANQIDAENLHVSSANIDGTLAASQIDATNLKIASGNVTGKLTAAQIDTTYLHVKSANIDGTINATQIDATNLNVKAANIDGIISSSQIDATSLKIASGNVTGKLTATQIDTSSLHVNAANIDGVLNASQINATNLHVSSANIDGTISADKIDATELHVSSANIDGAISCDRLSGGAITGQKFLNEFYDEYLGKTFKVLIENGSLECEYSTLNTPTLTYIDFPTLSGSTTRVDYGSIGINEYNSMKSLEISTKNGAYLRIFDSRANTMVYSDGVLRSNSLYTSAINGIASKQIAKIETLESGQVLVDGSGTYTFTFNTAKASTAEAVEIVPIVTRGVLWSESTNGDLTSYTVRNIVSTSVYISMKILKISYKSLS